MHILPPIVQGQVLEAESVAQAIEAKPCVPLRVLPLRKFLAVADAAWERSGLFAGK